MKSNIIISFLLLASAVACSNRGKGAGCFLASTPVDLIIINPTDEEVELSFYYFDSGKYRKLDKLKMEANDTIIECFDNEGPVIDGLYILAGNNAYKKKLRIDQDTLDMSMETDRINFPRELEEKIKE